MDLITITTCNSVLMTRIMMETQIVTVLQSMNQLAGLKSAIE